MYKILIADDNPLILMGMKSMIQWDSLHATLAGEAKNGAQALQMIIELKPNLVITDIRMPGKDGLFLLDKIKRNYPDISTVVISAYDDFVYAKKAIVAGCIDYILKPIDPKELNAAIKKAMNRKKSMNFEFADLVSGSQGGMICALKTEKNYEISDISEFLSGLKNIEIRKLNDIFLIIYHKPSKGCKPIEKLLQDHLKGRFLFGKQMITSSDTAEAIWGKVLYNASGYILTAPHMDYHFYSGNCMDEESIIMYCTTGNDNNVKEIFHGLIAELLSDSSQDISRFINHINAFLQILLSAAKKTFEDVRKLIDKIDGQRSSLTYYSVDEIVKEADTVIENICAEYARMLGNKHDLIIRVKDMIKKNYQNDISLSEIAQLFYVTPSYLSRVFKQETGTNLNSYITEVRMNEAKHLLEETDEKVIDIAHKVGYSEPNYFTKVFKKYNGYSPNDKR